MRFSDPWPLHVASVAGRCRVLLALPLLLVAGCATAPVPQGINDPLEPVNRGVHGLNLALDRVIVGPGSDAYGTVIPAPARRVVGNVAGTLNLPGDIVNDVLQANPEDAGINVLRLATNLTMGVLGIFDAATAIGLPQRPTDFGETLHVWGAGEGVYVELPVFGPSTARDAVGLVVDTVANPVRILADRPEANAATAADIFARLGDRYRYSDTIESILYQSADSYEQARLLYLQNRRFELGQTVDGASDDDFVDPYEDPYGQ
jgi:phospholipid-binding lipoprotein MlaA